MRICAGVALAAAPPRRRSRLCDEAARYVLTLDRRVCITATRATMCRRRVRTHAGAAGAAYVSAWRVPSCGHAQEQRAILPERIRPATRADVAQRRRSAEQVVQPVLPLLCNDVASYVLSVWRVASCERMQGQLANAAPLQRCGQLCAPPPRSSTLRAPLQRYDEAARREPAPSETTALQC